MTLRSLLLVPGDNPRKLEQALGCGADALIIDLQDSVAAGGKGLARLTALAVLREQRDAPGGPKLFVRINGFDTELAEGDLDAVMAGAPHGIVLPRATGGVDMKLLDARLAVREALHGLPDGGTRILAMATQSAVAVLGLGTYRGASPRLMGMAWGAESLSADIGALAARSGGEWTDPFRLARSLCLFGAAAAGVAAIDGVHSDINDLDGLRQECDRAFRDGFSAKLAIHPAQVDVINEAFTRLPREAPQPGR